MLCQPYDHFTLMGDLVNALLGLAIWFAPDVRRIVRAKARRT